MTKSLIKKVGVCLMLLAVSLVVISVSYGQEEGGAEAGGMTFLGLIKAGGMLMVPILLGSVAVVALSIEHLLKLQSKKMVPEEFVKGIEEITQEKRIDMDKVESLCASRENNPLAQIVLGALEKVGHGRKVVEETISDIGSKESLAMQRKISWLSIIAIVSPMLGLLGTVTGMIRAFQVIVISGTGRPALLAQGVSEALITTAAGLMVAIPAMLAHFIFKHRVQGMVTAIEGFSTNFLNSLYGPKSEEKNP